MCQQLATFCPPYLSGCCLQGRAWHIGRRLLALALATLPFVGVMYAPTGPKLPPPSPRVHAPPPPPRRTRTHASTPRPDDCQLIQQATFISAFPESAADALRVMTNYNSRMDHLLAKSGTVDVSKTEDNVPSFRVSAQNWFCPLSVLIVRCCRWHFARMVLASPSPSLRL